MATSGSSTAASLPSLPPTIVAIDSHCHLHDAAFDADREVVWARAQTAGVRALVEIGASDGLSGNERARVLAERYDNVSFTVGIHPHEAKDLSAPVMTRLEELADHPRAVAIGETGLDYHYDHSPRSQQQAAFRQFIALARRRKLPLTVHLRAAEHDALAILREEHASEVGGVIHCFTSDWATAQRLLDLGFFLSFSGIVTFKRADTVREVARKVPADRFLIETDAPYLAPVPCRGRRNEPAFLLYTAACLAELRGLSVPELVTRAMENTLRAFPRLRVPAVTSTLPECGKSD